MSRKIGTVVLEEEKFTPLKKLPTPGSHSSEEESIPDFGPYVTWLTGLEVEENISPSSLLFSSTWSRCSRSRQALRWKAFMDKFEVRLSLVEDCWASPWACVVNPQPDVGDPASGGQNTPGGSMKEVAGAPSEASGPSLELSAAEDIPGSPSTAVTAPEPILLPTDQGLGLPVSPDGTNKKSACQGLGLFYTLISAFLFSVVSLFLKLIEDVHSVEISAIRCIFQMTFVLPGLIYYKTGFLGPKGKRIFLFFRGLFGSSAMILLYYAYQMMPLADATVITFSSPVFTSLLACIFLKESYSLWDFLFTLFTIAGVVLIARPPFLFGSTIPGIEGSYANHLKGTVAAVASASAAALTIVILRKMGKSVHYFLSTWYYAVIGLIVCIISLFVIDAWSLPNCNIDRFFLILIGVFGLGGQIFLTKALQIEKAGPVAIMRTIDVVFAFIFQIIFLNHMPTWWTVGGSLCVLASSCGTVIRKWYQTSQKIAETKI